MLGALIGAGASILGSVLGGNSSKKAAQTAANAQLQYGRETNALARDMYERNAGNLEPFRQGGLEAGGNLNALLAGDQSAFDRFRAGTNYNFRLNEGLRALDHSAASRGMIDSGASRKAAIGFGQSLASNELGNYMNFLQGQQQMGLAGASALAGVGQNFVNTSANTNQGMADALSNSALMRGAANQQMWGGIGNALGMAAGNLFGSSYKR